MGVQLHIKHEDMLKAGWTREFSCEEVLDIDEDGFDYFRLESRSWYQKGDMCASTYSPTDFCWDSNEWGTNRARHEEMGLFDIPHELY